MSKNPGNAPLKALASRLGLRRCDVCSISGLGYGTINRLWREPYSPGMRVGVLVRLAYSLGVSPLELMPGLQYRPAHGPVRLGSDAAVRAVLYGERLERVHVDDVKADRLPAPGEMLRTPPPVFDTPAEGLPEAAAGVGSLADGPGRGASPDGAWGRPGVRTGRSGAARRARAIAASPFEPPAEYDETPKSVVSQNAE